MLAPSILLITAAVTVTGPHRNAPDLGPVFAGMENEGIDFPRSRRSLATSRAQDSGYGVMIDAGSSGTRIYVYSWPRRNSTEVPLVESVWDKTTQKSSDKTTPGISSFSKDLSGLQQSLDPLIAFAERNVPTELHKATQIYMYATAGMRVLAYSDQDKIMSRASALLSASAFAFDPSNVAIITGQAEGYYGWVAANFLSGTFKTSAADTTGVGALDLGGASTQVAGAVAVCSGSKCDTSNTGKEEVPGLMHVHFNGRTYTLFATSFLGFGYAEFIDDVKQRLWDQHVVKQNPCYLSGTPSTYTSFTTLDNNGLPKPVDLPGSGDFFACLGEVNAAFLTTNTSECARQQCKGRDPAVCKCSIGGAAFAALPNTNFIGMGGFKPVLADTLKIPTTGSTRDARHDTVENFCGLDFAQAKQEAPTISESKLATTCAAATEILALLDLYGISQYPLSIDGEIDGIEVNWALGAMVSHANMIPVVRPPT